MILVNCKGKRVQVRTDCWNKNLRKGSSTLLSNKKKPTQSVANEMRKFKIHFDVWKCRQSSRESPWKQNPIIDARMACQCSFKSPTRFKMSHFDGCTTESIKWVKRKQAQWATRREVYKFQTIKRAYFNLFVGLGFPSKLPNTSLDWYVFRSWKC